VHRTDGVQPGSGPCKETYASGFRNPFRFVQRPGTSNFLVNDVGQNTWEEINELRAGKDYGWNIREGNCTQGSTTDCGATTFENPIYAYAHPGCQSITGGAFVPPGLWPAPYAGSYLFGDFVCNTIFRLVPKDGGGYTKQPFLTNVTGPVTMGFGPWQGSQALYWLSYFGNEVHRVSYAPAGNQAPVADFTPRPDGRTVAFDGSKSYDPDGGDSVRSWQWTFGDGSSTTTSTPRVSHTYPAVRTYTATLRVVDSRGAVSAPVSRTVYSGEHAPVVTITAPPLEERFAVGQPVTVKGTATDAEDGALPITWTITRRHGTHEHPFLDGVRGPSVSLTYPAPENLAAASNSHLVATAVATDSLGHKTTTVRNLLPRKVTLSFATSPAGGAVLIAGSSRTTPASVVSWAGYAVEISARDQPIGGVSYVFSSWSDGGARTHVIKPTSATTYTARFVR
jgi:PKD repeat protein